MTQRSDAEEIANLLAEVARWKNAWEREARERGSVDGKYEEAFEKSQQHAAQVEAVRAILVEAEVTGDDLDPEDLWKAVGREED